MCILFIALDIRLINNRGDSSIFWRAQIIKVIVKTAKGAKTPLNRKNHPPQ